MKKSTALSLGFVGVLLLVSSYFLVSFNMVSSNGLLYQSLNLFGALGIIVSSDRKKDLPPVVLNTFWAIIALISIVRILIRL